MGTLALRERIVLLYFENLLSRLGCTPLEFFETAYQFVFEKQGNVVPDYITYIQHGVLPKYVQTYMKHLQE